MLRFAAVIAVLSLSLTARPQSVPASPTPSTTAFDTARSSFSSGHFDVALAQFKRLLEAEPGSAVYAKFASEAALNTGDNSFTLQTLEPFVAAHPDDWQAHMLLARAYAQTSAEPEHAAKRDAELALLNQLHSGNPASPLGRMRDFLLEKDVQGDTVVEFFPAFVPWGPYHVHLIARLFNAAGQPGLRITLESNDIDQTTFAAQHPAEAAKGMRAYSLDGYAPDQHTPDGRLIQTHYTYSFLVGEPKYDDLRTMILAIAAGKTRPMSSRSGPVEQTR